MKLNLKNKLEKKTNLTFRFSFFSILYICNVGMTAKASYTYFCLQIVQIVVHIAKVAHIVYHLQIPTRVESLNNENETKKNRRTPHFMAFPLQSSSNQNHKMEKKNHMGRIQSIYGYQTILHNCTSLAIIKFCFILNYKLKQNKVLCLSLSIVCNLHL